MDLHLSHLLAVALGMMLGSGVILIVVFMFFRHVLMDNLDATKELLDIRLKTIKYIESMQNLRKVKDDQSD